MTRSRVIPKQKQGVSTDTVSKIKLDTVDEALWDFEIVKDRLLEGHVKFLICHLQWPYLWFILK